MKTIGKNTRNGIELNSIDSVKMRKNEGDF